MGDDAVLEHDSQKMAEMLFGLLGDKEEKPKLREGFLLAWNLLDWFPFRHERLSVWG